MKIILLCGGLGTRLRPVIGEKQKAMADVEGKPFLHILVDYIKSQGIKDFVFACGYKKEEVEEYFGNGKNFGINAEYAIEETPLGTGGAIRNCLQYIDEEEIFVANSDTLFEASYNDLYDNMKKNNTSISIIVKNVKDIIDDKNEKNRYGNITIKNNFIETYVEKPDENLNDETYINGGIYIIKKHLIESMDEGPLSFEKDFVPKLMKEKIKIGACVSNGSFIDIGTPDSYEKIINLYKKREEKN